MQMYPIFLIVSNFSSFFQLFKKPRLVHHQTDSAIVLDTKDEGSWCRGTWHNSSCRAEERCSSTWRPVRSADFPYEKKVKHGILDGIPSKTQNSHIISKIL